MFRKKHSTLWAGLSVIMACSLLYFGNPAYGSSFAGAESSSLKTAVNSQPATPASNQSGTAAQLSPSLQGASYLMIDVKTSAVLAEKDIDVKRYPASTTKLLTGLAAMEKLKESDVVRVGQEVQIDGSVLGLRPGDEITVENLLKACYLVSANDAAAALAVEAGETMENFMYDMNKYAQNLGCTQTHFINPHGLHDQEHYTTAQDLTKIALAFINHPVLKKYPQMSTGTIEWKRADGTAASIEVSSTNQLLGVYPGSMGLKTGTTTPAGQCLISYVSHPDGDILLTLLGSSQRYTDSVELLDRGFAGLRIQEGLHSSAKMPERLINSRGVY